MTKGLDAKFRALLAVSVILLALIPLRVSINMLAYAQNPNNITIGYYGTIYHKYIEDYTSYAKEKNSNYKVDVDGDDHLYFRGGGTSFVADDFPVVKIINTDGSVTYKLYGPEEVTVTVQYGEARSMNKSIPFTFPNSEVRYIATLYRMPLWILVSDLASRKTAETLRVVNGETIWNEDKEHFGRIKFDLRVVLYSRLEKLYFVSAVYSKIRKYTNWTYTDDPVLLSIEKVGDSDLTTLKINGDFHEKHIVEGSVVFHSVVNDTVKAMRDYEELDYPRNPEDFKNIWRVDGIDLLFDGVLSPPVAHVNFKSGFGGFGSNDVFACGRAVIFAQVDVYLAWVERVEEGEEYEGETPEDIYANIKDFVPAVIETQYAPWWWDPNSGSWIWILVAVFAVIIIIVVVVVVLKVLKIVLSSGAGKVVVGAAGGAIV